MTVLVTGGRGRVGRLVVEGLLAAGVAVRASSRDPRPGDFPSGVEAVRADLTDPSTLPAALDGVTEVFLYTQPEQVDGFVRASADAGVEHVVLLSSASVLFPDADTDPIGRAHLAVERAIDGAGISRTFLRPAYFATNALRWATIRTERLLRTAFPDASTAMVHERDIAEVAVAALTVEGRPWDAVPLLGTGASTVREQVATIQAALGEPVRLEQVDEDVYRRQQEQQLPAAIVDRLIAARGHVPVPPPEVAVDGVQAVLGRPPLPFSRWARDHAGDFR